MVWTRGSGCSDLARLVGGENPPRVVGDLTEACIRHRARLLVTRKIPSASFDLVDVAVPYGFRPDQIDSITAAVGGGPHSTLAARVGRRLAGSLGVGLELVSVYRTEDERPAAEDALEQALVGAPDSAVQAVQADGPARFMGRLGPGSLVVLGAPGGSLLQRWLLGPGARIRSAARAGSVIVRSAPPRVFQVMDEPPTAGPLLRVGDARRVVPHAVLLPVADNGRLIGLVRRAVMLSVAPETPIGELLEPPASVHPTATIEEAARVSVELGRGPVPVTDDGKRLVGWVPVEHLTGT